MHGHAQMLAAANLALLAFMVMSAVDGVYLHLVRYRLHAHPGSYREHLFHTARAILIVPVLLAIFASLSGGALLWAGVVFVALDQLAELLDLLSEKASRAPWGGLGTFEYVLHILLTSARAAAIALALAARPAEAWSLDAPVVLAELPAPWALLIQQAVIGAVLVAAAHVWLALRHRPAARVRAAA